MNARFLLIPLLAGFAACADPGSSGGPASGEVTPDAQDTGAGETAADTTAADATASDTTADDATGGDSGAADDTSPADPPDVPGAGPDNPNVGCRTDAECAAGELCCTLPLSYLSDCVVEADCHPGLHDACLVDAQCSARRPGEWTVCCHDLGNRNYCAPGAETCQPLVACTTPADCAGNGSDVCCSPHPYYEGSFCTNTFFALPERDCP